MHNYKVVHLSFYLLQYETISPYNPDADLCFVRVDLTNSYQKVLLLHMGKQKHKKSGNSGMGKFIEIEADHGIFSEYLQYGSQYDTVNDCPVIPGETEFVEWQRLRKLSKDTKSILREYMTNLVEDYWNERHLIPADADLKRLRSEVLQMMLYDMRIYLKDDKDVKPYLDGCVVPTINKLLKKEK